MVYAHISHGLLDSPAGDRPVTQGLGPPRSLSDVPRRGRRITKGGERFVYDGYLNIGQTVYSCDKGTSCEEFASIYYSAVKSLGNSAYEKAQKEACDPCQDGK